MKKDFHTMLNRCSDPEMDLKHGMPLVSERIRVLTMSKIHKQKARSAPAPRQVLLAAVLIAVMTISVFAAGSGAEWLVYYFADKSDAEMSPGQVHYIEDHTLAEEQSQTINGYTVTLKSYFNDGGIYYLKFDVQAPVGERLPKIIFGDWQLYQNGERVQQDYGEWRQLDANDDAGWGSYLAIIEGAPITGNGVQVVLTNLEDFNDVGQVIVAGQWIFDLEAIDNYQIDLVQAAGIPVRAQTVVDGESFEVRIISAKLSAMNLELEYEMPDTYIHTEHEFDDIEVTLQDGSTITLAPDFMYGHNDLECIFRAAGFSADAPLELNEVACIEFPGGARVRINAEE